MSLKEELREILRDFYYSEAKAPDDQIDQILATISNHLPERWTIENPKKEPFRCGYNQALTDINKLLTTNKKGKV